jgi:diadenosine tetraphosphate (Ap4A) HIT family hydrolase
MAIFDGDLECPFCAIVDDGVSPVWRYLFPDAADSEVVWSSDLFTVALDTAPIVEGHLLLISNDHITSLAGNIHEAAAMLEDAKAAAENLVSEVYGDFTYFEHGALSFTRHAGACVDHAHLHILPGSYNILADISRDYPELKRYSCYEDALRDLARTPYLLFGTSNIGVYGVSAPVCSTQYLRKLVSFRAKVTDKWNWRDCIRRANSLHLREQLQHTRLKLLNAR